MHANSGRLLGLCRWHLPRYAPALHPLGGAPSLAGQRRHAALGGRPDAVHAAALCQKALTVATTITTFAAPPLPLRFRGAFCATGKTTRRPAPPACPGHRGGAHRAPRPSVETR